MAEQSKYVFVNNYKSVIGSQQMIEGEYLESSHTIMAKVNLMSDVVLDGLTVGPGAYFFVPARSINPSRDIDGNVREKSSDIWLQAGRDINVHAFEYPRDNDGNIVVAEDGKRHAVKDEGGYRVRRKITVSPEDLKAAIVAQRDAYIKSRNQKAPEEAPAASLSQEFSAPQQTHSHRR